MTTLLAIEEKTAEPKFDPLASKLVSDWAHTAQLLWSNRLHHPALGDRHWNEDSASGTRKLGSCTGLFAR
jgi:hypothetical protein